VRNPVGAHQVRNPVTRDDIVVAVCASPDMFANPLLCSTRGTQARAVEGCMHAYADAQSVNAVRIMLHHAAYRVSCVQRFMPF
jgi:hypothetical protein